MKTILVILVLILQGCMSSSKETAPVQTENVAKESTVQTEKPSPEKELLNSPCRKNDECVLFGDTCKELHAVLSKEVSDKEKFEWNKEKNVYARTKSSHYFCEKKFIMAPIWPENPVAVCTSNKCTVNSSSPKKK